MDLSKFDFDLSNYDIEDLDDVIELIVYGIFNTTISLDDPSQTINEIKEMLNVVYELD